ncbi:hypothetical protein [Flavihumibacter fluvii]|uniref:hypothetical protein n=1 Tax=Flavihumibacter fluvii TaxID=2838157 RepID=UPI001BDF62A2|nr:hypothetical protein [Flavihumibacter fluvii]ULQ54368.1 hypothetical protein KJS93_08565 [Flavihumibacter fluvii]
MNWFQRLLHRPFFIRLFNWEYWSFNTVYAPIIPIWLILCARARSLFFFSASNPTIMNGGFLMESKIEIYNLIPANYYPRTLYFSLPADIDLVLETIREGQFSFPMIGKPNIGARGMGVRKLYSEQDIITYCNDSALDFLVQEYIGYEKEVGIFYYRLPGEPRGRITGIVGKEFLGVTGNGQQTIRELVMQEKRFILQLPALEAMFGKGLEQVLAAGVKKELVPYGNHARGAKFLDDSHLVTAALEQKIDEIAHEIKGFYYGRLDIRFKDWDSLGQGKDFSIIELNGAGSEPTHMYDPRHSVFYAWKEIIRHWILLFRVSRRNHKNGVPYMSYKDGRQMFRDNAAFEKKIEQLYV